MLVNLEPVPDNLLIEKAQLVVSVDCPREVWMRSMALIVGELVRRSMESSEVRGDYEGESNEIKTAVEDEEEVLE